MIEDDRYEELFQDSPDSVYNAWWVVMVVVGGTNPRVPGSLELCLMQDYDIDMHGSVTVQPHQLPAPMAAAADAVLSANPFMQFTTLHVPAHLTLTQDVSIHSNVHQAQAAATLLQPAATLGLFQLPKADVPAHTAPAPTPAPASTPPSHLTPNEW